MNASVIQDTEHLGRRVSEKKPRYFKHIRQNIESGKNKECVIPYPIFKPPAGETELSVDRLNIAPVKKIADIAKRDAYSDNRIFHGWAVIRCKLAIQLGFKICPSPKKIPFNPYHADLMFPDRFKSKVSEIDYRKIYAQKLAENAEWLSCPK